MRNNSEPWVSTERQHLIWLARQIHDWHKVSRGTLRTAVTYALEYMKARNIDWLSSHPEALENHDNVLHCRAFRIAAGWNPPRAVDYDFSEYLYMEDRWARSLIQGLYKVSQLEDLLQYLD